MLNQSSTRMVLCALTAMSLLTTIGSALAADAGKYPTNWKGEWTRVIHREVEVQGATFTGALP